LKLVGKESTGMDAAPAGDIAVLPKLLETATNDTLSAKGDVRFAPMPLPEPLFAVAIRAKNKADEDKLGTGLNKIVEEEPTLRLKRDSETHQTVLSALGDTQIDVVMARLKARFGVETELVDLRIPYRETIRKIATAQGRHKKQTGGSGQFGDTWLRLEPNPGKGYEFLDEIVGGRIPRQYIPHVDKGVQDTMVHGVLAGYPVVDVKVAVYDGSYHAVDSSELAFKTAARIAHLTITVPEHYAGDVMGDMSSKRGKILGMEGSGGKQVIKASVPFAEVVGYALALRSLSHGTGSYAMEIGEYAEVPFEIAKKVIEQHVKEKAEE
jgi:elongation factor G